MRFCGCDTSVSVGSMSGCSVMALVVRDAAAMQGRRRPEPGRLYAAMQANSFCCLRGYVAIIAVHVVAEGYRGGSGGGGVVVTESENRWAAVYSDIKRWRTRNSGCEHQLQRERRSESASLRRGN
jgi:hypothetical protein